MMRLPAFAMMLWLCVLQLVDEKGWPIVPRKAGHVIEASDAKNGVLQLCVGQEVVGNLVLCPGRRSGKRAMQQALLQMMLTGAAR